MVRLNRVARGIRATMLAKLEYLNPGGSVKDRIGITMLEAAEKDGKIKPGGTIIEGTSGNTGMGLALAAAIKGYQCIFTMPDKMSQEKNPKIRVIGADPAGSIFAEMFNTGRKPAAQPYKLEGIGQDEMPANVDFSVIDEIYSVTDKDAFLLTRRLARYEGIFAGGSAGAALYAALKCADRLTENDVDVIVIPDSGTRYLSNN